MAESRLFSNPVALTIAGIDEHIVYKCTCSKLKNLSRLYFCRYCTKLRCSDCVSHEVDSYFCPNCLENMPSAEAKLKKMRCGSCFDCPSCGHTLSIRVTSAVPSSPGSSDTASSKKVYYLSCGFCRWTTRDIGLPDQTTVSGAWPEPESSYGKQMSQLVDYYRQVTQQEKLERDKQKLSKRRSYSHLADKFGLALSLSKKRTPPSLAAAMLSKGKTVDLLPPPNFCETISDIEPLPSSYYTDVVDLDNVLSIEQRLAHIETQPEFCKQLYPRHKKLNVRCSQRCRECEHNLSKPEFNPSAIKFKIHLGALLYIPQIKIVSFKPLIKDQESQLVISVSNPLEVVVSVKFQSIEGEENSTANAKISLPAVDVAVSTGDGLTEFEDTVSSPSNDDPSVVKSRSANKVQLLATIEPLTDDTVVKAVFMMVFSHKTPPTAVPLVTATTEQDKKPENEVITHEVVVHLSFTRQENDAAVAAAAAGDSNVLSTLV